MARKSEIDPSKYMEFMESTLDQLTSSMDLDFDVILGKPNKLDLNNSLELNKMELDDTTMGIIGIVASILIYQAGFHKLLGVIKPKVE